jgi:hypothetical protein
VAADPFRPQSVGRALRTAFVLGLLIVIALVAAVGAAHQFTGLVGDNRKDELSRYLDDNAHTTAKPGGAGFTVSFPVPPVRRAEPFSVGAHTSVAAQSEHALVDDEVTFDAVWLDLVGKLPADPNATLRTLVAAQVRQLTGTMIGLSVVRKIGPTSARDVAFVTVDRTGTKHFYDERILLRGRRVWVLRIASRIRRDAAFQRFVASFILTG